MSCIKVLDRKNWEMLGRVLVDKPINKKMSKYTGCFSSSANQATQTKPVKLALNWRKEKEKKKSQRLVCLLA